MQFLAIEPFFFADQYWPATPDAPFAFEYPKGHGPNVRWYPLDEEADALLQEVQKQIRVWGSNIICHRIPRSVKKFDVHNLPTPIVADPNPAHPSIIDKNVVKEQETFTMAEVQGGMKPQVPKQHQRPSDTEPRKG